MRVNIPGFSGGDRTDLELPAQQEKLIEAAIATGKPVVVVLTSGSALAANYASEHAAALLESWYNGEEAGTAIAETLAGVNNPGGRLPVTFYKSVDQLPKFCLLYTSTDRPSGRERRAFVVRQDCRWIRRVESCATLRRRHRGCPDHSAR